MAIKRNSADWQQGSYYPCPTQRKWPLMLKRDEHEKARRSVVSGDGQVLCRCDTSEQAAWIAERLNTLAKMESAE